MEVTPVIARATAVDNEPLTLQWNLLDGVKTSSLMGVCLEFAVLAAHECRFDWKTASG